jgi:hypothetical protein
MGLLLMIQVSAGDVTDRQAATAMLPALAERFPTIRRVWADGGCTGTLITWAPAVASSQVRFSQEHSPPPPAGAS